MICGVGWIEDGPGTGGVDAGGVRGSSGFGTTGEDGR